MTKREATTRLRCPRCGSTEIAETVVRHTCLSCGAFGWPSVGNFVVTMNTPEQDAEARRELEEMLTADTLRPEDRTALRAIAAGTSIDEIVALIHVYYGSRARADRTPRSFLYMHFGMLMGACTRIKITRSVLSAASGMLEASAEHLEPLAVGYGAEQMRSIARLLREAGGL